MICQSNGKSRTHQIVERHLVQFLKAKLLRPNRFKFKVKLAFVFFKSDNSAWKFEKKKEIFFLHFLYTRQRSLDGNVEKLSEISLYSAWGALLSSKMANGLAQSQPDKTGNGAERLKESSPAWLELRPLASSSFLVD